MTFICTVNESLTCYHFSKVFTYSSINPVFRTKSCKSLTCYIFNTQLLDENKKNANVGQMSQEQLSIVDGIKGKQKMFKNHCRERHGCKTKADDFCKWPLTYCDQYRYLAKVNWPNGCPFPECECANLKWMMGWRHSTWTFWCRPF